MLLFGISIYLLLIGCSSVSSITFLSSSQTILNQSGMTIELDCKVDVLTEKHRLVWVKTSPTYIPLSVGSDLLLPLPKYALKVENGGASATLVIHNFTDSDIGQYECVVTNTYPTLVQKIDLHILHMSSEKMPVYKQPKQKMSSHFNTNISTRKWKDATKELRIANSLHLKQQLARTPMHKYNTYTIMASNSKTTHHNSSFFICTLPFILISILFN